LLDSGALFLEGRAMRHCVYSYTDRCRRGETTIWSLRLRVNGEEKRMVTIEVDGHRRCIIQLRAKCNLRPGGRSLQIIQEWATHVGLKCQVDLPTPWSTDSICPEPATEVEAKRIVIIPADFPTGDQTPRQPPELARLQLFGVDED